MIPRYTRPELGAIWTDEARMRAWRDVEVAACEEMTGPSPEELGAIRAATFTVAAVEQRERVTDHDLAAFVDVLAASAGPAGRWIHHGLTSSDVLDTALALQLRAAGERIVPGARALVEALAARAREHVHTPMVGRTHGVHAEPTTLGIKLAGFAFEADRNARRLQRAFAQAAVGALSGAVGTYAATSPDFERRVLARLGLRAEDVSTQVVPRDRHAEVLQAVALAGAGLERLATEVRHLQRTEVRELEEPFGAGQKGSSAMPHKRNPIVAERIAGLARVLRGHALAALEDVALWHERDISHSSVERVILPDATILLDYLLHRAVGLVRGMEVHPERMLANLELTHGAIYSQRALLALVERGLARDDAYRLVQRLAQRAWETGEPLRELLAAEPAAAGLDLDAIFDPGHFVRHAEEIVGRLDAIAPAPERPRRPTRRARALRLDDVEALPGPGTLTWRPVRAALGLRAFGTNAYAAEEPGRDVVEPHTENPALAHEELYFVHRGRAAFTVDGEQIDAPAGTYVFVPDPASHRHAVAAEPGTAVLSFGGPPSFTPSAWEWAFQAGALAAEQPERAREVIAEGLRVHPDSPSLHYALACVEGRQGDREAALAALRRAVARQPDIREWAREDDDLAALRDEPEFRALTAS